MSLARDLYTSKTSNFILMLINKLIKYAIYVAITKNLNAKNFVNLMWKKFIYYYKMMRNIISNKDSLFTSYF